MIIPVKPSFSCAIVIHIYLRKSIPVKSVSYQQWNSWLTVSLARCPLLWKAGSRGARHSNVTDHFSNITFRNPHTCIDVHNVTHRTMSVLRNKKYSEGPDCSLEYFTFVCGRAFSSPSPSHPRRCSRNTLLCPIPSRILTPVCPLKKPIQAPTSAGVRAYDTLCVVSV